MRSVHLTAAEVDAFAAELAAAEAARPGALPLTDHDQVSLGAAAIELQAERAGLTVTEWLDAEISRCAPWWLRLWRRLCDRVADDWPLLLFWAGVAALFLLAVMS